MTIDITIQLQKAQEQYKTWSRFTIERRLQSIETIKDFLLLNKKRLAHAITTDMNKPISESIAEIEKCALLCEYYLKHAVDFLQEEIINSPWKKSYTRFSPMGVVLGIMPWNFPFWQVFRFAIPTLIVGNVVVLKHASNVPTCVQLLDEVFAQADTAIYFPIVVAGSEMESVIAHSIVKAVSFTGSEKAGRMVATTAGKYLKKCVLELGGSNAFIVLNDADIEKTAKIAVKARFLNSGQSCIAAKRFLIQREKYDAFLAAFIKETKTLNIGDKYDAKTQFSEMAREDLAIELETQLSKSVEQGATILLGGSRKGAYFEPTIVENIQTSMPLWKEETFGPVAPLQIFDTLEDAIEMSNASEYGLGVSIFTKDITSIQEHLFVFEEGTVFINEMVISYPSLPFAGIKNSGYGRELSRWALYEFSTVQTVVVS